MLVLAVLPVGDIFDHDAVWSCDLFEIAYDDFGLGWDDFNVKSGFFFDFTKSGLDRVFVRIDVTSRWEPFLNFFVPVQQRGVAVNDEACGCEMAGCRGWHEGY